MSSDDTDSAQVGADIAAEGTVVESRDAPSEPRLVAYEFPITHNHGFDLVGADSGRRWMNATYQRYANRCLPMLIANQSGWLVLNNSRLTFRWNGGSENDSVEFLYHRNDKSHHCVASDFGDGIVTWSFPFLIRTSPGYDLLVRGPANLFKDGIAPLESLVETASMPTTFTMNWKITRPGWWITFEPGEPLCMLVPQRQGELEAFHPEILPLDTDPELRATYDSWLDGREPFYRELAKTHNGSPTAAAKKNWHKNYFQGRLPDGSKAPEHQTRLRLRPFARPKGE